MLREQLKKYLNSAIDALSDEDLRSFSFEKNEPDLMSINSEMIALKGEVKKMNSVSLKINNNIQTVIDKEEERLNEEDGYIDEDLRKLLDDVCSLNELVNRTHQHFTSLPEIQLFKINNEFNQWKRDLKSHADNWNDNLNEIEKLKVYTKEHFKLPDDKKSHWFNIFDRKPDSWRKDFEKIILKWEDSFTRIDALANKSKIVFYEIPNIEEKFNKIDNFLTQFNKWREGYDIYNYKWQQFIKSLGLKTTGKVGEQFDANYHEAIATDNKPEIYNNQITECEDVGYLYKGEVIRTAKVVVNKIIEKTVQTVDASHSFIENTKPTIEKKKTVVEEDNVLNDNELIKKHYGIDLSGEEVSEKQNEIPEVIEQQTEFITENEQVPIILEEENNQKSISDFQFHKIVPPTQSESQEPSEKDGITPIEKKDEITPIEKKEEITPIEKKEDVSPIDLVDEQYQSKEKEKTLDEIIPETKRVETNQSLEEVARSENYIKEDDPFKKEKEIFLKNLKYANKGRKSNKSSVSEYREKAKTTEMKIQKVNDSVQKNTLTSEPPKNNIPTDKETVESDQHNYNELIDLNKNIDRYETEIYDTEVEKLEYGFEDQPQKNNEKKQELEDFEDMESKILDLELHNKRTGKK